MDKNESGRISQLSKADTNRLLDSIGVPRPWEDRQLYTPLPPPRVKTTARPAHVLDNIGSGNSSLIQEQCGTLSLLPEEIMYMFILSLNFPTLAALRTTNSILEKYIGNLPCYKLVLENCREALLGMTKMGFHDLHTVGDVYTALLNPKCWSQCGNLGDRLFLPSCRRCCNACVGHTYAFEVVYVERLAAHYGLSEVLVNKNFLTFLENNSHVYRNPNRNNRFPRKLVVGGDVVRHMGRAYGTLAGGNPPVVWDKKPEDLSAEMTVRFPFVNLDGGKVEFGRYCRACHNGGLATHHPTKKWDEGRIPYSVRVFTDRGLLSHVLDGECPETEFWKEEAVSPADYV